MHAVYDELPDVLDRLGLPRVQGVLFDLGVSSMQLDEADRGFAYAQDAPLDMRMDQTTGISAAEVLNTYPPGELVRILRAYGEEKQAKRIVSAIVRERDKEPFSNSARLVELIRDSLPQAAKRTGGNPAKRTFQALRIEVNGELAVLERAIPAAVKALAVGGRIAVLSYHSLEDRLVKQVFAAGAANTAPPGLPVVPERYQPRLKLLTRGAELPTEEEVAENRRAAPARLRGAEAHPRGRRVTAREAQAGTRVSRSRTQGRASEQETRTAGQGRAARPALPAGAGQAARTPFVLLVVLLLGGGLIGLLVLNSALNEGSFQLDDLQKRDQEPHRPGTGAPTGRERLLRPRRPPAPRPRTRHGARRRPGLPQPRRHRRACPARPPASPRRARSSLRPRRVRTARRPRRRAPAAGAADARRHPHRARRPSRAPAHPHVRSPTPTPAGDGVSDRQPPRRRVPARRPARPGSQRRPGPGARPARRPAPPRGRRPARAPSGSAAPAPGCAWSASR